MKIDLTKDEWEFMRLSLNESLKMLKKNYKIDIENSKTMQLLRKLGTEWIDEEEEMRKFHMGFAYKPKVKDDHI